METKEQRYRRERDAANNRVRELEKRNQQLVAEMAALKESTRQQLDRVNAMVDSLRDQFIANSQRLDEAAASAAAASESKSQLTMAAAAAADKEAFEQAEEEEQEEDNIDEAEDSGRLSPLLVDFVHPVGCACERCIARQKKHSDAIARLMRSPPREAAAAAAAAAPVEEDDITMFSSPPRFKPAPTGPAPPRKRGAHAAKAALRLQRALERSPDYLESSQPRRR
jgi:hypothetical protein